MTKQAIDLLQRRYCRPKESPKGVFRRVASALSLGDSKFEKALFNAMYKGYFLPNSPCLRNAGEKGLLLACFKLPIEDSITSIFDTLSSTAQIFHYGGGVGINFSNLRPAGSLLSSGGEASGTISFISLFDQMTEVVKQGGFRRGALMGVLRYDHPEIIEFVRSKLTGKLSNFNLSVLVDDDFMKKVKEGGEVELVFGSKKYGIIKANDLFDLICFSAWSCGCPGLLFFNRINKDNPYYPQVIIDGTNPCVVGETLIAVADGRQAVSIKQLAEEGKDVPVFCQDDEARKQGKLKVVVKMARNFRKTRENVDVYKVILDDGSSITSTADHQFMLRDGTYRALRELKAGDSLMPFNTKIHKVVSIEYAEKADVYNCTVDDNHNYMVVTRYNPDKSSTGICVKNCGEVPLFDYGACCLGSINLSKLVTKTGSFNFPLFSRYLELATRALLNMNAVTWAPLPQIMKRIKEFNPIGVGLMGFADALIKLGIYYDSEDALKFIDELAKPYVEVTNQLAPRSFYRRIIAPTGSLSILADCSPSVEPVFSRVFIRQLSTHSILESRKIYSSKYVRTAHEISPEAHLAIQARFQQYLDGSISKTVNLPYDASVSTVRQIFLSAWEKGCKGITVYRDKSKETQVFIEQGQKCEGESCSL